MKIFIVLLLLSVLLGICLAFRLASLRGGKLLGDLTKSMAEAQEVNREMLRRRFGHNSGIPNAEGEGLFEVVASPMFGFVCIVVAAMLFAHPESILYQEGGSGLYAKGILLMVGQVALLTLFVCSISLTILRWRKK